MAFTELLSNPAVVRALVVGAFGGAGLVLTVTYSRRGPMIFPVYAALLAALAVLLSRYAALPYSARFAAACAGFAAASAPFYVAVMIHAGADRRRHRAATGASPAGGGPRLLGYVASIMMLVVAGTVVSAGVAFIAG